MQEQTTSFDVLGIAPGILSALAKSGITTPTPIQAKAIPPGMAGTDLIGIAQTGTGKTLAFGIPLVERLMAERQWRGLVVVPTRELALQVEEHMRKIAPMDLKMAVLIGGTSMVPQLKALRARPNVIIATPGRLIDHLEQKNISLESAHIAIIDEADRMLDMGFWPQIQKIIQALPAERQTMLFSATLSPEILQLAGKHMHLPVTIEVAPPGTTADKVSQELFIVRKDDKIRLLEKILAERAGSAIVFSRTKHGATRIMRTLRRMGHAAAEIHSNRSLNQRRDALEGFKSGTYRVLVATDIAARGIDVKGIGTVINYDLPQAPEDYVHRVGRTARAGADGHAISFAEPNQRKEIAAIERLIRKSVPISKLPADLPEARPQEVIYEHSSNRRNGSGGNRRPQRGQVVGGYFHQSASGLRSFHSDDPRQRQAMQARQNFDRGRQGGNRRFGSRRRFQQSGK
ncbi:MAG: DEAD/DEAH box helicase [Minisyncoccia bacterium]